MRYPVLFSLLIFLTFSCVPEPRDTKSNEQKDVVSFHGDEGEPCFEIQLEVWLMRFHQLQQMGHDMHSADEKARESAVKAYLDCRNTNDGKLSVQAKKE